LDITVIILILVGALVIYFATRFMSNLLKIVTKVLLLVVLVLVILTALVYKDMTDLKKGFETSNNTFFLYENNKLYTALTLKPLTNLTLSIDSFNFFSNEELQKFETELNDKNNSALLENNYKVLILKPIVINKPYNFSLGAQLTEGDLLEVIMSDNASQTLAEKASAGYGMSAEKLAPELEQVYGGEEKIKAYLFAALLGNYFQTQTPGELTKNIKDGRIVIYPETISFKIIKYLPWV